MTMWVRSAIWSQISMLMAHVKSRITHLVQAIFQVKVVQVSFDSEPIAGTIVASSFRMCGGSSSSLLLDLFQISVHSPMMLLSSQVHLLFVRQTRCLRRREAESGAWEMQRSMTRVLRCLTGWRLGRWIGH